MQKTNWIILASKDRGMDYGVGTFIKQLSRGLAKRKNINVFVLEIGLTGSKPFAVREQEEITVMEIPVAQNTTGTGSKKEQEKLSRNIARVVSQYIPAGCENIIHMNYLFQYFIADALKKALNGRTIFTQHIFASGEQPKENYFDTESQTYETADKIVAVTKCGKNHLIEKGAGADKIEVVYNGADPGHFKYKGNGIKEKYGLGRTEKTILYSGRIDPVKGLGYLCTAMEGLIKRMPGCRLVIAGNGDFEPLVRSSRKFAANISFLGFVPFEELVALYREADIGVIPSLQEQCSYVALEMLFCGLPAVASNLGGLKEIFVHGENALLADTIPDKTNRYGIAPRIDQLESNMFELLTDNELRTKFARNAKKRANKLFTTDIMINNYLQTIENLNQDTHEQRRERGFRIAKSNQTF